MKAFQKIARYTTIFALFIVILNSQVFATQDSLFDASLAGDLPRVKALLATKADVNAKAANGATALIAASQFGSFTIVKALLAAKADVKASMTNGVKALIVAAQRGHLEIVQTLIDAKANVNAKLHFSEDDPNAAVDGTSALFIASGNGHFEIVRALLRANADVNARIATGKTALMVAKDPQVRAMLEQATAGQISNLGLPTNPEVDALSKRALQLSNGWGSPFPPSIRLKADATEIIKRWQSNSDQGVLPQPASYIYGENMSVFALSRVQETFVASSDIPSADGKISSKGVLIQISNQDPLTGKQVSYLALSGVVWTPRTIAIGRLDLSAINKITTNPEFKFDAYKNSPGIVPFSNGYGVNIFGQAVNQVGILDSKGSVNGSYVTDDGKRLSGRVIRLNAQGGLEETVIDSGASGN